MPFRFVADPNLTSSIGQYAESYKTTLIPLVLANVFPLFGVMFLGWSMLSVALLFWAENIIVGAINVLKMAVCSPSSSQFQSRMPGRSRSRPRENATNRFDVTRAAHHGSKLFLIPFFIFHYGMFCFVHGAFVVAFFSDDRWTGGPFLQFDWLWQKFRDEGLLWGLAALAASHLVSFYVRFLRDGEYRRTTVHQQMFMPYPRIVPMHLALIFGGFFVIALGSPIAVLVLLVIGKTIFDIASHVFEHELRRSQRGQRAGEDTA